MGRTADDSPVRIIEAYTAYTPPRYVRPTLERLLRTVPPKYLAGLESVVLTNFSGESRANRVGKTRRSSRKIPKSRVAAFYKPASRRNRPYIEVYADKVAKKRGWYSRIPVVRDALFGVVFFHELGHHVHYTLRPEHRDEELVADEWSKRFLIHFLRKRYWYWLPVLWPAAHLAKAVMSDGKSRSTSR